MKWMPRIHDLRTFLIALEDAGQLVRVRQPVRLEHELTSVAAALERRAEPAPPLRSELVWSLGNCAGGAARPRQW